MFARNELRRDRRWALEKVDLVEIALASMIRPLSLSAGMIRASRAGR
jgi:hypothetical protein